MHHMQEYQGQHNPLNCSPVLSRIRFFFVLILIMLSLAVASQPAYAATLTVCASGCDHTTIAAAIGAATAGDTIDILDPVHTEAGITINKDLTIQGQGAENTIIQGHANFQQASDRVFQVNSGNVVFKNLTIQHGATIRKGGGILIGGGTVTVDASHIISNTAGQTGGGISNGSMLNVINDSLIKDNFAQLYGGGIDTPGTLIVSASQIIANEAGRGGGIRSRGSGKITINNGSLIEGNSASSTGGGIHTEADNGGNLIIEESLIRGNEATRDGGGIWCQTTVTIREADIINNLAAQGGGLYRNSKGTVMVEDSLFSENTAIVGAGIFNVQNAMSIENSTISNNNASSSGGGIFSNATLTVKNSTINGNAAPSGGGIFSRGTIDLSNTIIASSAREAVDDAYMTDQDTQLVVVAPGVLANDPSSSQAIFDTAPNNGTLALNDDGSFTYDPTPGFFGTDSFTYFSAGGDCFLSLPHGASIIDSGHNLIEDSGTNACGLVDGTNGNIIGQDPNLGPLRDNGGPTHTHALLTGSQAVDNGDCSGNTISDDQRSTSRPQGNGCDIGAFEGEESGPTGSTNESNRATVTITVNENKDDVLVYSGNNPAFTTDYSEFAAAVNMDMIVQPTFPADLTPYRCIILPANQDPFSPAQIALLEEYITLGGHLFAISDFQNSANSSGTTMNALASELGINMAVIVSLGGADPVITSNIDNVPPWTTGVSTVQYWNPLAMGIGVEANSLVRDVNNAPIVGVQTKGHGNFFFSGDHNAFSTGFGSDYSGTDVGTLAANICNGQAEVGEDVSSSITEALDSFNYSSQDNGPGFALGTLTINFGFIYNGNVSLSNVYYEITVATNAFVRNVDSGDGTAGSILVVPNSDLPTGDNTLDPGDTLLVPFAVGVDAVPWTINFLMYGDEVGSVQAAHKTPVATFTLDSSMFDLDGTPSLEPKLFLPLVQ
ncbi:MAG: Ig-like domain-containing protein [Chloroflexota bacterium]